MPRDHLKLKTFTLPPNLSSLLINYHCPLTSTRLSPTSSSHPTLAIPHKLLLSIHHLQQHQQALSCRTKERRNSQLMPLLELINPSNSYQNSRLRSTLVSKTPTVISLLLIPLLLLLHSTTDSMQDLQVSYLVEQSSDN